MMMAQSYLGIGLLLFMAGFLGALAEEDVSDAYIKDVIKEALYFINACGTKDLSVCLKEKVLSYLELLPDTFELAGVVKIKRTDEGNSTGRKYDKLELPDEPKARETALDNILMNKIVDFISSHSLELKVPQETIGEMKSGMEEEGRKKKKGGKKGGGMGIFMLFYLKLAMLAAIALKILALLAFKALVLGKIALTISGVIALKKLFEQKHTSTYEVIAHPHYEEYGQHDRSYGRDLAYRGRQEPFK